MAKSSADQIEILAKELNIDIKVDLAYDEIIKTYTNGGLTLTKRVGRPIKTINSQVLINELEKSGVNPMLLKAAIKRAKKNGIP